MKLAVVGSRGFEQTQLVITKLEKLWESRKDLEIVTGGADGPDKVAEQWAREKGIPVEVFLPDDPEDKSSYIKRNAKIVEASNAMMAFWDGVSAGCLDSIIRGKKRKDYYVVTYLA